VVALNLYALAFDGTAAAALTFEKLTDCLNLRRNNAGDYAYGFAAPTFSFALNPDNTIGGHCLFYRTL
jgi:hypothetical protein